MSKAREALSCSLCSSFSPAVRLLDCLHNCCESCIANAACTTEKASITCPTCHDITSVADRSLNRVAAVHFSTSPSPTPRGSESRDMCCALIDDDDAEKSGSHTSSECSTTKCDAHASDRNHCVSPPEANSCHDAATESTQDADAKVTVAAAGCKPTSCAQQLRCDAHSENCNLLCMQCKTLMCSTCIKACLDSKHEIEHREGERASEFLESIITGLRQWLGVLESNLCGSGEGRKQLLEDLQEAQKVAMSVLLNNKKTLLAAAERAYKVATDSLEHMVDQLAADASAAAAASAKLDNKARQAVTYGQWLLECGDTVSLLQQQQQLLTRMQALVEEFRSSPMSAGESSPCIVADGSLPENLDEICQSWIGLPKLLLSDLVGCSTDGGQCSACQASPQRTDEVEPGSPRHNEQLQQQQQPQQPEVKPGMLTLKVIGSSISSFNLPVKCYDLVVTAAGHLMLATKVHGLKEYDVNGRELSGWTTKVHKGRVESVWTVDILHDGRVAVGLARSRCVLLLRRGRAASLLPRAAASCHSWLEDRLVARLQSAPRRTAVHADVLAIAEGIANSQLVLVCLPGGHELLRQELDYLVESMAVTAYAVVTASYDKIESDAGGKHHVMDCYSYKGDRLWRRDWSRLVRDICPAPSGQVLYLALCDDRTVSAISSHDGCHLGNVMTSSTHGLEKPLRLSGSGGQRALIAILSSDCKTVTIYAAAADRLDL